MSLYMPGIIRVTLELGRGWCLEHLNGQMDIRNWLRNANDDRVWSNFQLSVEGVRDCIVFALIRYVIGPENRRHFLIQSDSKLQPLAT